MIDPVAECGIRQLHARYVDAVWRKDSDAFGQCWTEDARWRIAGIDAQGRTAVTDTFDRLIAPSEHVLLMPGALVLHARDDGISGALLVTEFIHRREGSMRTIGLYRDRYVRECGEWRFAARDWQAAYRGAPDFSGEMLPRD